MFGWSFITSLSLKNLEENKSIAAHLHASMLEGESWRKLQEQHIVVQDNKIYAQAEEMDELKRKLTEVTGYYAQRVRIGHKPMNVYSITAQLRGQVDSSLIFEYDGNQVIVSGNSPLEDAQYNKVVSILGFELNRT